MKSHSVALYCKNIQKSILARSEEFQVLNAISRLPGKLSTKPKFFNLPEIFRKRADQPSWLYFGKIEVTIGKAKLFEIQHLQEYLRGAPNKAFWKDFGTQSRMTKI